MKKLKLYEDFLNEEVSATDIEKFKVKYEAMVKGLEAKKIPCKISLR